ncbi:MAG: diguanylate cyclase [Nitrosomonadales bacterium]|nr:diguanylate cyclase [Nitrosomonadales bacterium]
MRSQHTKQPVEERVQAVRTRWEDYKARGQLAQFTEFTVSINSLTERFNVMRMPGLVRLCEALEMLALDKMGESTTHPLAPNELQSIDTQLEAIFTMASELHQPVVGHRKNNATEVDSTWLKPRSVLVVAAPEKAEMADALCRQLAFFRFKAIQKNWDDTDAVKESPLAVLFIPNETKTTQIEFSCISTIRSNNPTTQLIYLGKQRDIESIVALLRSGIDVNIPYEDQPSLVMSYILDLVQTNEQEKSRVLIVEDSKVAVAVIERTLSEHGIDTHAIHDPGTLLKALETYRPDLIMMDMHMPRFNGVEATRVLRQIPAYSAIPIVYLSGESEISMQIEALRLGGDQFLIKPVNPILLAAIIKTKIERSRETLRSSRVDGLTGLLNHTAAKSRLQDMVGQIATHRSLTVAMIDIDRFKSINDTYGHPVGDQVIRSLAWLLKGHLRTNDLIGRYGGEEFLVALPGVTLEQAYSVIDRIRSDYFALPHSHPQGSLYASFSTGIASYSDKATADTLTQAADNALLLAKRNGRNRIEKAPPPNLET